MLRLYPLFWLACSYILGELLHNYYSATSATILLILALLLIVYAGVRKQYNNNHLRTSIFSQNPATPQNIIIIALAISAFTAGGYRYTTESNQTAKTVDNIAGHKIFAANFRTLESINTDNDKWRIKAELLSINNEILSKPPRVTLHGNGKTSFVYNDTLYAERVVYLKPHPTNYPGEFSYTTYLQSKGITCQLKIIGKYRLTENNSFSLLRTVNKIRSYLLQSINKYASANSAGFLQAALLGNRDQLEKKLVSNFKEIGISHIIAISGLHLSLIILLTWFFCSWFNLNRRYIAIISIMTCLLFLGMTGSRASVIRASVVAIIYLSGIVIYRESNFINSVGAAALIICLIQPLQIYDIGMQLSFTSVLFISSIMQEIPRIIHSLQPEYRLKVDFWKYYVKSIPHKVILMTVVTTSAWAGSFPLITYYFHQVSIIGFIANIVIVPLMTLSLAGGLLLQLCPLLPAAISGYFAVLCSMPTELIIWLSSKFATLPLTSVTLFPPASYLIILYYLAFALLFFSFITNIRAHLTPLRFILLGTIIIISSAILIQGRSERKVTARKITLLENRVAESVIMSGDTPEPYNIILTSAKADYKSLIDYLYQNRIRSVKRLYITGSNKKAEDEYRRVLEIEELIIIPKKANTQTTKLYPLKDDKNVYVNLTRNASGRIIWYYFKNKDIDTLVTAWQKQDTFMQLFNNNTTGHNAEYKFLRITKKNRLNLPTETAGKTFRYKYNLSHPSRREYGVIRINNNIMTGWNGEKFVRAK